MFKNNKNLVVIAVIAVVNALGYGIIIPVLYSYSQKFGLTDFQNGLLFALFSLCQFLSTPIIGRLSDLYGRKPLLIISLTGTALSFALMAVAPNALILFLARALDGITAGNIPVASAVISDTTEAKDRARGFGLMGAAFGFGFIFGPAISALTLPLGDAVPFIIAAIVTVIAIVMTAILLPETNKHKGHSANAPLFNFKKLVHSLFDEKVGRTLLITLVYSFAFALFIYAYQPFAVKVLGLSAQAISVNFTVFGIMGLIAQAVLIPRMTKIFGERRVIIYSIAIVMLTFAAMFASRTALIFFAITTVLALANSFVNPLIQTLLSKEVDEKAQGTIQGINSSYMSLGMIFGPIIGGALATFSIPMPFLGGSLVTLLSLYLAIGIPKVLHKEAIT